MSGGAAGSGKGGIGQAATEALGRLTRHDHRDAVGGGGRRLLVALSAIVLILAGWGVWELLA